MDVFVKVRSTRAPQPALVSRGATGIEVSFADAEEGVAPGQACVIYDAAEGQARVLGGGVIAAGARLPAVRTLETA
jgi:tRNA-specific 2-thiouridylase